MIKQTIYPECLLIDNAHQWFIGNQALLLYTTILVTSTQI